MNSEGRVEYKTRCPRCEKDGKDRTGDNLAVYADGHSWCYSCKHYIPTPSLDRLRAEAQAPKAAMNDSDLNFPADYTPLSRALHAKAAFRWLKSYAITDKEIADNNIGWSSERSLLIYPVYRGDDLFMWQARNFGDGQKYLTYGPKSDILHVLRKPEQQTLIVTEDLVSAIKVSRVYNAAPLWGASMPLKLIKKAASQFAQLGIWLDPDKTRDAVALSLRASQYLPTFVVTSAKDPKNYAIEGITEFVEEKSKQIIYQDTMWDESENKPEADCDLIGTGNESSCCHHTCSICKDSKPDQVDLDVKINALMSGKTECAVCRIKTTELMGCLRAHNTTALLGCPFKTKDTDIKDDKGFRRICPDKLADYPHKHCILCQKICTDVMLCNKSICPIAVEEQPWDYRKSSSGS